MLHEVRHLLLLRVDMDIEEPALRLGLRFGSRLGLAKSRSKGERTSHSSLSRIGS
jgi:hypothetical protein